MRHRRHYTLDEARAQLHWVSDRLAAMRGARERLTDADARAALAGGSGGNGGGALGKRVGEAFLDLQAGAEEMAERDIVLRDLDRGLVDFPALRDGREVYLCWQVEEPEVGHWHAAETGYPSRLPLDPWL